MLAALPNLDAKDGHVCVNLFEAPRMGAAMCLGSERDYSRDADIQLP